MKTVLHYIKKYPASVAIMLVVIWLSFFRPPLFGPLRFQHLDKVIHFCMYGVMSGVLWVEFLKNHREGRIVRWRAFTGAALLPALFSGLVEIFQERWTAYRSGDGLDFAANIAGIACITALAWFVLRPLLLKKRDRF